MTQLDDSSIRKMVDQVLSHVHSGWGNRVPPVVGPTAPPAISDASAKQQKAPNTKHSSSSLLALSAVSGRLGQFSDVNDAVAAAVTAQRALMRRSLAQREQICDLIRTICVQRAEELGRLEYEETKIGHPPHKPVKLELAARIATGVSGLRTECFSGDHGITLEEHAPWGVIGALTPVTHSLPTVAVNAVQMIAAGNAVVFNPHPGGKRIAALGARLFNQAIYDSFGIDNLICVIVEPTLESAEAIFHHHDIRLLCITGGPGAVAAAMKSGKRAVCAGPGNPPVVVDASADLDNAARCIIEGAAFDNNLLCLAEKEAFIEAAVFDKFLDAMSSAGAYRLTREQMDQLAKICLSPGKGPHEHPTANRKFVGAEPRDIAREIGLSVPADCRLLFGPTDAMHPFVQAEQMMPVLPVVRCETFEQCIEAARQAEHGFRHTAVIHSRLVDHMTTMGKALDTTLYVKNGPSLAGNGAGGEGYASYSIACTTGEGISTPMTFTRFRRCTMVDNLRII